MFDGCQASPSWCCRKQRSTAAELNFDEILIMFVRLASRCPPSLSPFPARTVDAIIITTKVVELSTMKISCFNYVITNWFADILLVLIASWANLITTRESFASWFNLERALFLRTLKRTFTSSHSDLVESWQVSRERERESESFELSFSSLSCSQFFSLFLLCW